MSLLVAGHSFTKLIKPLQIYNSKTHDWVEISLKTPEEMFYCVALLSNQLIFSNGGYPRRLKRYDVSTGTWPPMREEPKDDQEKAVTGGRTYAVFNGQLYAIGGNYGNYKSSDRVERWNPATNTWLRIAHLKTARSWAKSTVMDDRLYVAGGNNGGKCLRHTEYYSLKTQEWKRRADMNEARSSFGFSGANGYLYAVGGINGNEALSSVERYDPKANKWTMICSLPKPRSGAGCVYFENRLWAIGGYVAGLLRDVEQYNVETDKWITMAPLKKGIVATCFILSSPVVEQLMHFC